MQVFRLLPRRDLPRCKPDFVVKIPSRHAEDRWP